MAHGYRNMPKIVWKPVLDFEDRYEVSSLGEIRSLRGSRAIRKTPRILNPKLKNSGYLTVDLRENYSTKKESVHIIVLEAFISRRPKGLHGCHQNGNRLDNRIENLKWMTPKENHAQKKIHGTGNEGKKHYLARFKDCDIPIIRKMYKDGMTTAQISLKYKCGRHTIFAIVNNKTWRHIK